MVKITQIGGFVYYCHFLAEGVSEYMKTLNNIKHQNQRNASA